MQEPPDLSKLESAAPGGDHRAKARRARPGFSAVGILVSVLIFLCAAWALFVLNTRTPGINPQLTKAQKAQFEAPAETPPINIPDEAFEKPKPITPPPLPKEIPKAEPVKKKPPAPKPVKVKKTVKPTPPAKPPREIIERVPKAKAEKGTPWYSVRAGYSESRSRTDTLREVLAGQGFPAARTMRDTDGLYCVEVADFRFRHLAEETFGKLEEMGFEPTIHERTVAR